MNKLIAVVGPTASGKTALSIKLAKKFRGEIISADSRQVYRGMDVGTAKAPISSARRSRAVMKSSVPSKDGTHSVIISGIRHYLINIKKPTQRYTLQQFKTDATKTIHAIVKKGRTPFLVGGTGFYIHALLNNLNIPEVKPNAALRKKLEKLTTAKLFSLLKKNDPVRAKTIDRLNPRRLIRAIEIAKAIGKVPTLQATNYKPIPTLILGLKISKTKLRQNINRRVDLMMRQGLVGEGKKLIKRYGRRDIFLQTIGYAEIIQYLDGKFTLSAAAAAIKKNTWHYTKHQYNWFRRLPVIWIKNQREAERKIKNFLNK